MNIKQILTVVLVVVSSQCVLAQDPTFTQFYANPIYLNPAFAGSNNCPRFAVNYRNEWPNLSGNYVTTSASYDQYVKNISGGIGVLITNDQQGKGTIQTSMLGLVYSYHVKVNRKFSLMFGARASWYQKTLDWDKLTFGDMIDPRKGFIYATGDVPRGGKRGFFDASAGVVGYSKNFFFGFASHHLNEPNESMIIGNSKLPMRLTGHMGAEIKLGKKSRYNNGTSIMPNVIYQYQQGFQELCIGTYIKHNVFTTGIWFRNKDAFIVSLGINSKNFKIGYSYDVTVSKLNNGTSHGSHEISLGLNLNCKAKPTTFRTIACPSF
ncbi:MAG: type IX secretion system membrane protein PorP/SprF [Fluviicola sp.]|jgi:type IX secretion system PorP/SprF family membrane protein|nr:type IX secretion system membrane protein PorP/SprF [Fluviicola sp.]